MQRFKVDSVLYLSSAISAIVGVVYGSVPLYRTFCQKNGYGVKSPKTIVINNNNNNNGDDGEIAIGQDNVNPLRVTFLANAGNTLKWRFKPLQKDIVCKPGQSVLVFYKAESLADSPATGIATYSIIPAKAASYFNKIQCFCFEEQTLLPGEQVDMPVYFFIDPLFASDPDMASVNEIILSYTFFKTGALGDGVL